MTHARHGLPQRYENARLIAQGGMGEVWYAHDAQLGRPVAIKLLLDAAGNEPMETLRARFVREARAAAQLSGHGNIVAVYDVGDNDHGSPFMTMQWMDGGTLAARSDGIDDESGLRILAQVARGLDAAHVVGVIHRDVKPGNIMFDDGDVAHVGDFGIALLLDQAEASLTRTGAVIGTPSYMSPEQASGHPAVAASDQYALASIAYQLVVGRRPFERDSSVAELAAHLSEAPPTASTARPDLAPEVDRAFERALAKHPDDRFSTCTEFVSALAAAVRSGAPAGRSETGLVGAAARRQYPLLAASARTPPRRTRMDGQRRALVLGAGIITAVALGAGAVAVLDSEPTRSETTRGDSAPGQPAQPQRVQPEPSTRTEPAEPVEPAEPAAAQQDEQEAIRRQQRSFELLQAGDFQGALDEGRAALQGLRGVENYEAYANYNIGASLIGLGRCTEAAPYLDRSEQLQGQRSEIDAARSEIERCGQSERENGKGNKKEGNKKDDEDEDE